MFSVLYGNIGRKIKSMAAVTFFIEAIGSVIAGTVFTFIGMFDGDEAIVLYGLLAVIFGPIVAWVSSWMLYAFGDIADNLSVNRANTDYIVADIKAKNSSSAAKKNVNEYIPNQHKVNAPNQNDTETYQARTERPRTSTYIPGPVKVTPVKPAPAPGTNTFVHNEDKSDRIANDTQKYCKRCGAILTSNECSACGAKVSAEDKAESVAFEHQHISETLQIKKNKNNGKFKQLVNDTSTEALMLILKTQRDSFSEEEIEIMADELRWRRGKNNID